MIGKLGIFHGNQLLIFLNAEQFFLMIFFLSFPGQMSRELLTETLGVTSSIGVILLGKLYNLVYIF